MRRNTPGKNYYDRVKNFKQLIRDLKPGFTELIIHPSYRDKSNQFMSEKDMEMRDSEARIFQRDDFKVWLKRHKVKLISWRDIARVYDWDKVCVPEL